MGLFKMGWFETNESMTSGFSSSPTRCARDSLAAALRQRGGRWRWGGEVEAKVMEGLVQMTFPDSSMYGIFTYIYLQKYPNVGI